MSYICEVCGREVFRKIKSHGYVFCNKHYKQLKKYGHVLDRNPRTILDKNEFHVDGNVTYIDLYDKDCNVIAQAMIDTEDIHKVKYTKWKLSNSGYAMNTPKFSGGNKHMSHEILGTNEFVDHINHNKLDNRKSNLRIVTRAQNQMNVDYKGVSKTKSGKYYAHIKLNQKLLNLGVYVFMEEAFFARWYAETILFGEYRFPKEKPCILPDRELEIMKYVDKKVQRL